MSEAILQVDLKAGYGKQCVLSDVAFDLHAGERLGLVGTSGVGKSTLALSLMGLLPMRRGWAKGKVLLRGHNLLTSSEKQVRTMRGKAVSLVPQSAMSALNGSISLRAHFEEAWRAHERPSTRNLSHRTEELMRLVCLPTDSAFLDRKPGQISVGQAQRIVIAMALLHRPALLIADEPTSALDPVTRTEIIELFRNVTDEVGTALLYISHDLLSVLQLCDRMAVLEEGRIVETLSVQDIETQANHPATRSLLRSLPAPAEVIAAYGRRFSAKRQQEDPQPTNLQRAGRLDSQTEAAPHYAAPKAYAELTA